MTPPAEQPPEDDDPEGRFSIALSRLLAKLRVEEVPHIKRIVVTIIGGTVLIFGMILIVTPGPAVLVIPAGLAILGTEYAWARRWLRKARAMAAQAISKTQGMARRKAAPEAEMAAKEDETSRR